MLATIQETLKDAFSLKKDIATPEEIQEAVASGAKVKGTNMCILILAILIASIGLNMNSTAVIIGAMLISPLMGGIIAIGYGIAVNDLSAAKKAAIGLTFQVIICILTSTIYFAISPISVAHSEILARTSPSVWDVLIATFGGLAGIIGITRKEKTNVIPGVAIATALMPPLCTAGYGIACGNFKYFLGAIYLFFINSFFICLSTIVIVKILKLPCKEMIDAKAKQKLYLKLTSLAIITVIPSIFLAYQLITESITNNNVKQFLNNEINYTDTQIVKSNVDMAEDTIEIALLGQQLGSNEIDRLQNTLSQYGLEKMTLKITQPNMDGVITAEDLKQYVEAGNKAEETEIALALKDNEIAALKDKIEGYEEELSVYKSHDYNLEEMQKELNAIYPSIESFSLGIQKGSGEENTETLLVVLHTNQKILKADQEKIKAWFSTKTAEENVNLLVQGIY